MSKTTKEAFEAMSAEDWDSVLLKATCAQQVHLIAHYKKIIGRYQHLCGELYQVLGALDAPAYVLDRVSNASESMVVSNTPSLLPFDKHAWPIEGPQSPPFRNPGAVCGKCGGTGKYPTKGHGLSTIMRNCPCGGSGE